MPRRRSPSRERPCRGGSGVGGDEDLRTGVFHTELQRLGGETTEDEGVDRANTRAGEGENNGFGDDGQVDDHTVTLAHAQGQQTVRCLRDAALQLGVGDGFAVAGFTFKVEGYLVAAPPPRGGLRSCRRR